MVLAMVCAPMAGDLIAEARDVLSQIGAVLNDRFGALRKRSS